MNKILIFTGMCLLLSVKGGACWCRQKEKPSLVPGARKVKETMPLLKQKSGTKYQQQKTGELSAAHEKTTSNALSFEKTVNAKLKEENESLKQAISNTQVRQSNFLERQLFLQSEEIKQLRDDATVVRRAQKKRQDFQNKLLADAYKTIHHNNLAFSSMVLELKALSTQIQDDITIPSDEQDIARVPLKQLTTLLEKISSICTITKSAQIVEPEYIDV